jgi:MFS family permease
MATGEQRVDSARGWAVVAATFASTFTVFGVTYSFGAFFDSMAEDFGTGKSATALMFSITTAWYFGIGPISGKAVDRFGPRPVLAVAAVCLGAGLFATAQVESIWLGYVTYALGVGTAVACAYVPMVATVGGWFVRHRTTALGIAVAGIGAGTIAVAPIAQALIDAHGWRTAYRILGVVGFALLLVASLGAHRPPIVADARPIALRRIVRQRNFLVIYGATVLSTLALFVPFVFIKSYATDRGISSGAAASLVGIIGASSIVGRLGLGALGSRLGPVRLMQVSVAIMGASFVLWLTAGSSFVALVVFTIVIGVGYGGYIALSPAATAVLFGTVGLGAVLGAVYTGAAVGGLVGPPLAGEIIDRASYGVAIVVAMVLSLAAAAVLLALPHRR